MSAILLPNYEQAEAFTSGDTTIHIRGHVLCDTAADLPATTFFSGFTLDAGSTALDIATAARYMLNSAGAWILQRTADISSLVSDISALETQLQSTSADATYAKTQIDTIIKPALAAAINNGAKNRLLISAGSSTVSGVSFTINADGTVTADGVNQDKKATGNIFFQLGNVDVSNGDTIHLSGCPSGGSYSGSYSFYVDYQGGSTLAYDDGSGAEYTSTADRTLRCRISIRNGTVIDNLTFRPMICAKSLYNAAHEFMPYAPTNRELYLMMQ